MNEDDNNENKPTRQNLKHLSTEEKAERRKTQQQACMRRYYWKNKEKIDNNNKKHYYDHRDELLEKQKVYQKIRYSATRIPKLEKQLAELKSLTN